MNREAFEAAVKECGDEEKFAKNMQLSLACYAYFIHGVNAALASQAQQDHIGDSNKLVQAVNALAAQTGESPESITEWLTDKGGLTQLMLSNFGGMSSQAQQPKDKFLADAKNHMLTALQKKLSTGDFDSADIQVACRSIESYLLQSQAQQTERKQLSRQDILKVFYTLKDKDKHFPMIDREISSALGSQLFVYGWKKAVEFDIKPPAPEGDKP